MSGLHFRFVAIMRGGRPTASELRALADQEPRLTAALFALPQLEAHARLLAAGHVLDPGPGAERLLERLQQNERIIRASCAIVAAAAASRQRVMPATEWLLDNAYVLEGQIDAAREHLSPGYSRELPRLREGPLKGLPRVYSLAHELVSHTDGAVDLENLSRFVRA